MTEGDKDFRNVVFVIVALYLILSVVDVSLTWYQSNYSPLPEDISIQFNSTREYDLWRAGYLEGERHGRWAGEFEPRKKCEADQ